MQRGDIPIEKDGRFSLVPRRRWDAKITRLREQMRAAGLKGRRVPPANAVPAIEPEPAAKAEAPESRRPRQTAARAEAETVDA